MAESDNKYSRMRTNVGLLSICQAVLFTANSVLIASAALIGTMLAPDIMYATVPIAMLFLFGMGCSMPASLLMKYIGRRAGFQIGLLIGISGAIVSGYAITAHSFAYFAVGIALIGINNAFAAFYRFAAADVSTASYRSRAISYVLAGSVVAAFIGPNLVNFTKESIEGSLFAGSYFILGGLYLLALIIVSFLKVPAVDVAQERQKGRPLSVIARQPMFLIAVLSATVGYGVMNLLMTATPLAMEDRGLDFGKTAQVIQWHIFAMFAPSFFTGHLVNKFGELNIVLSGLIFLVLSITASFLFAAVGLGESFPAFCTTLVLLGIGWNFTFLGGTTLLTTVCKPSEKAVVQGFNDLCVFSVVTLTALMSGVVHHLWGWYYINAGASVPIILVLIYLYLAMSKHQIRPSREHT